LLILAHAPLASALREVAAHVYPEALDRLLALDVAPDCGADEVEQAARKLLGDAGLQQTLILSDVVGATPCNAAQRLVDGLNVRLVTGVNVPMLWRVLCYAREPLDALVARAVAGGTQGVMHLAAQKPQHQNSFSKAHDAKHAHHQQ